MPLLFMVRAHVRCVYLMPGNLTAVSPYAAWPFGNRKSLGVKTVYVMQAK